MRIDADQRRLTSSHYQDLSCRQQPHFEETVRNAAIRPAPSHRHADADNTDAGRLACRATRQDLRANQLRAVSLHRSSDEQPAQDRATVPHPASALPGRNPRRSSRRRHRNRPSDNAGIPARSRPDQRLAVVFEEPRINLLRQHLARPYRVCTVQAMISFASRPNASLNAATAAGGSTLSNFWLASNRRDAITFPLLSTILADNPISAVGTDSTAIWNRLVSIRSWKSACPLSVRTGAWAIS